MGGFVNSGKPAKNFSIARRSPYFVDKSALIGELLPYIDTENRFLCFIRPRRFGKTVMANMVASFLGKATDTAKLFEGTDISADAGHMRHLNKYNVVYIDFSNTPRDCASYAGYIGRIQDGINRDLSQIYPQINISISDAAWDVFDEIFEETGDTFIFVMDEWDAVFHMLFIKKEEQESFLLFLKMLLKGRSYVSLAYMTGVLPIAKYSSDSELNMFVEYDMADKIRFSGYFGFNDSEVDSLYKVYLDNTPSPAFTREDLSLWYDGYHTAGGTKIYNPCSVICALTDNQIGSYWSSSGPYA